MKKWKSTDKRREHKGPSGRWLSIFLPAFTLLGVLIIWEMAVYLTRVEKWLLPAPTLIFQSLWEARELLWHHGVQTITETIIGFTLAVVIAVLVATIIDQSPGIRRSVYPLLIVSQTIPIIALAPLLLIWLGYGMQSKVAVVALVCFFPVTINLVEGYRMADRDMIRLMLSMGASRMQIFRMVKWPAAMPSLFSGLRIAGTYSVMGAVIGEWLGASRGLGIFLTRSQQSFMTDRLFAGIIVITLLSLIIFALIEGLARLSMPWHARQKNLIN